MAIVTGDDVWCPGGMGVVWSLSGAPTPVVSGAINASGDRVAWIIQVPKDGTLDWFEINLGTVGNVPDNGLRYSFQDLDLTTGNPDGVMDQFADQTSGITGTTWATPANAMTDDGTGGGVKRVVTKGQTLCCVIDFVSFVASDSVSFSYAFSATHQNTPFDYFADGSGGTYAKSGHGPLKIALKYADGTYGQLWPHGPYLTSSSTTFDNTTAIREYALRFKVLTTRRVTGYTMHADIDGDAEVILYDSDFTTPLLTDTLDKDNRVSVVQLDFNRQFPGTATLLANTAYLLSLKPTTATGIIIAHFTLPSAALMAACWGGVEWYGHTRDSGGTWTPLTTNRPMMGLGFDGFDDGAGTTTISVSSTCPATIFPYGVASY